MQKKPVKSPSTLELTETRKSITSIEQDEPINIPKIIDELTRRVRKPDDLSAKERRAILGTQHSDGVPFVEDINRAWQKWRVALLKRDPDADLRAASAGSSTDIMLPEVIEHAQKGYRSAVSYKKRDDFQDKQDFQKHFLKNRTEIRSLRDLDKFPELKAYRKKYKDDQTLRDWINEVTPGWLKRGAPRKK